MTLPELLCAVLVLGLLASFASQGCARNLARLRVEAATRQLAVGLEQARSAAERSGQPCVLVLGDHGWLVPNEAKRDQALPPCLLSENPIETGVSVRHTMAGPLRISSTGLVLDGGTVMLRAQDTDLQRCLVVSLPLGMVRIGRSTANAAAQPRSSDCVADPSL